MGGECCDRCDTGPWPVQCGGDGLSTAFSIFAIIFAVIDLDLVVRLYRLPIISRPYHANPILMTS